jgi:PAS domain S-box-containing protein
MIEVYLILTGLIFFAWLYVLVRQTQRGLSSEQNMTPRPVVPVNLVDSDEAIVVAEDRGRVVYANDRAREWFGTNGGTPNLGVMARMAQPADTLHDLFAGAGHASFRIGQRRVDAVSHAIPGTDGRKMVIVMREMTASSFQSYAEFDPLQALAIMSDISQAVSGRMDLDLTIDAVLKSLRQSIQFDSAEITLWDPETETLRPVGQARAVRTPTGSLAMPAEQPDVAYRMGEGYSGWIAMYRQPLLIGDVTSRTDVLPKSFDASFHSYVGVPLLVGDEFIGTLELVHQERNAFGQRDVALLQTLAGQVSATLQAARLYHDQSARVSELGGLQQIAEAMSQLGEPSEMYAQLTQRIANLMDVELCGVLLYHEDERMFRSQPPFYGVPDALVEHHQLSLVPDTELYTVWHHQPWWYTNDPDSPLVQAMGFDDLRSAMALNAVALVPMIVGARRTGLLMVANPHYQDGFAPEDMRMLISFASQAAIVIENARLYVDEQRRARELGGLQQIAQAMGVLRSPAELYSQITARIANLMDVEMCGVLLYDLRERILVSQEPFYGLDDERAQFYQVPSPPGSAVARLWQDQDTWYTNDLRRDPRIQDTDLAQLALAVGMRHTVAAALVVGGNRLGIIQAANKLDGSEFTAGDARILSIFAGQAAILIDNARLYREMQRRTHEAEGLRAVTEIASRVGPVSETVEQVIIAIANLLESQVVAIGLVEESSGELRFEPEHVWGVELDDPYTIDAYAPGFEHSVLVSRQPFMSNNIQDDERLLEPYQPFVEQNNLYNAIQVPLIVQDRSIGELTVANKMPQGEDYTGADLQLLLAIGIQVAAMVDRMRLYQATDQDLRTRVQELDALSRVSHELSQTVELERILDVIRQEALRSTSADGVSIALLRDADEWDAPDQPELDQRYGETGVLSDLSAVEQAVVVRNEVIAIDNYRHTDEFDAAPEKARAALVVPVTFGEQAVGLIHLFAQVPAAFDQRVINFVLALTDQAAIAIGNARRYQDQFETNRQLRIRAERMGRIFELGEMFRRGTTLAEMLEQVAFSVQETVGFNIALISVVDERDNMLRRTAQAGLSLAVFEEMQKTAPPVDQLRGLMQDNYRISNSYFLPAEGTEEITADLPIVQVLEERMGRGARAWDPQDLMLVPFFGAGGRLLGLMSVDEPRSGRRPDVDTVEALEIFASQAAFAIENYRLIQRIQQEAEATRRERDRLAQLHMVASEIQSATDVPSRLQVVANGIHEAGWDRVVITLRDEHLEPTALIQAGYSQDEAMRLSDEVLPGSVWRKWINDLAFHELKLGAGYYMRYDEPWVRENIFEGESPDPPAVPDDEWHPQDVLYLPLVGQDQKRIIGMIQMEAPADGQVPTEASLQPFELFASQAAAAIETTRLYLETVRAAEQEQRLNEMMEVVTGSISPEGVLQAIGRGLQQMVPFTRMNVALFNEETEQFDVLRADIALDSSVQIVPDEPLPVADTATGFAYQQKNARLYKLQEEESARENFGDLAAWYDTGERSTLVVPMIAGGQAMGALRLGSELENAFGFEENLDLIQRLANLSAVALDNARLFQEVRAREQFSAAVQRVSQSLNQIFDLGNVLRTICDESLPILGVEGAYVWLVVGEELIGIAASGSAQEDFTGLSVPVQDPHILASRVVTERRPIYINDLQAREDRAQIVPLAQLQRIHAVLGVPLLREDRVLGALMLVEADANQRFDDVDVEQASAFAIQAAIAIENARLFEEAEQRASELDAQARRLALINRIATRVAQSIDPDEIYATALNELQEALSADYSGLVLFEDDPQNGDAQQGRLVLDTHPGQESRADIVVDLSSNLSIEIVRETHRPLTAEDVLNDPRFEPVWDTLEARGTRSLMIVPLIVGEQVIGTVGLDFEQQRNFERSEIEMAETIASQVSVALDKANLLREAEQRAAELDVQAQRLAVINRMSAQLAGSLDPDEIYSIILHELQQALALQSSGLMLIREAEGVSRLVLSTHPMDDPLPDLTIPIAGNPIAEYVINTKQPFVCPDIFADPNFEAMWDVQRARNTAAMLIVPIIMGDRVIGTIGLDSSTPRAFTDAEIELATTAANQAAVAIEKGRLFTETQQRATELDAQAQRLALINRVSTRLAQTLDPQEIYGIVLSELAELLEVEVGGLVLFEDEHTGRLVLSYPLDEPTPDLTIDLDDNRSIEIVRKTHQPLVSENVLDDPIFEKAWDVLKQRGTKSLLIVPLLVGDDVIGTIGLDSLRPRTFSEAEIELVQTLAIQASLAVEKGRLYNETLNLTIFNQAVVESIQQGIVVLDRDLDIRRVNRYMIEHYGWSAGATGQPLFDYRPDYEQFLREPIAVALGMGEPQAEYEVERRDPAGQASIRNYYVYPLQEGRTVTGIVMLVEDVTARAQLEADLNARAVQMAALTEVSSQITATLEPDQVVNLILDAVGRVIPYDGVALWLRAPDQDEDLRIAAARGYEDPDAPALDDLTGLTVQIDDSPLFKQMTEQAEAVNMGDVSAAKVRVPHATETVYKNWLGTPLISKGNVVGVLTLEKREPNFYLPLHEQLALTFANQAAVALENAQLFQETRARAIALDEQAQRLALLNRVSLALAQTLDLENILEIALRETAITLELPQGAAFQVDQENDLAQVVVDFPRGDAPPEEVYDLTKNDVLQHIENTLVPLAVEDIDDHALAEDLRKLIQGDGVAGMMLVPLLVGGNMIGLLRLDALDAQHRFTTAQIELAQTIASQAAIAVQNASLYEQSTFRTRELETLFESAQATAVTLDLNEVVRRVTVQMLSALRADACTIFLWDDVNNQLTVRGDISARPDGMESDLPGDTYNLDDYSLREQAVRDRELLIMRADDDDLPPDEQHLFELHRAVSRMLIPLVVNEVSIGLVEVETLDANRYFRSEDVRLARTLASQAAISIENARLQTETRRTVEELYIINDMSAALSSAVNLEELLEVVDLQLPNLTEAQKVYVALYDAASDAITFPLAMSVLDDEPLAMPDLRLGQDEFSTVIKQQTPLLLAGQNLDQVQRSLGIEPELADVACFLGVPLFAGEEVVGVLAVVDDDDATAFSHNDQRILTTVGSQLGVAIQSTRLFQQTLNLAEELDQRVRDRTAELEQERQHISTLYDITTELATSLDMERLLGRALEMVAEAVGATQGALLAIDPIAEQLHFRARLGWPEGTAGSDGQQTTLELGEGLAGWAVQNRRSVIIDNVQDDPRWLRLNEADDVPRAAMVSLIEANEDILGVIMLYSEQHGAFNDDQLRLVTAAANQVANAMNNAELYSLIRDQAERLGRMLRQEQVEATKNTAILDSVAEGVMVADAEGQVIVFNRTAEQILELPAEKVLNRPTSAMAGLYGAAQTRWAAVIDKWMSDPTLYTPGEFLEERITLEDERVISVRVSPVHMGDQFLGTVSVFRDITRDVEVDRLKSEFVATVSHELRTPMTSIKGYADLLLLGAAGDISEQQQRFLETIKQNADRLSILVNDLLDISRIDQGRLELKFDEVEVEDLLNTIAVHLRGRAEDENHPMQIETVLPDDRRLAVWGDYDKVAQIFTNLADNAFNYTPADGTITLAASYNEDDDHVIISVADTGIGIPPEVSDRIFERFFRGDEAHEMVLDTPGTGLGLSIVREYVNMHGGEIWFESAMGEGTTFFVEMPAKPADRDT